MTDEPIDTRGTEELDRELAEFQGLVVTIRDAVEGFARAYFVKNNVPVSPGVLMSALLNETAFVCLIWGQAQQVRREEVEEVFDRALRNARRALREMMNAPAPTKN